jgi:hypothetical protein
MRRLLAAVTLAVSAYGQGVPEPLLVTRVANITTTPSTCTGTSSQCVDNRSSRRQNDYHSIYCTGSGSWTAELQYSATGTGSWTSYGAAASISQASNPPIAYGIGNQNFIRVSMTGSPTCQYSASKQYYLSTSTGAVSFPLTVEQGGTGAASASAARTALGFPTNGIYSAVSGTITGITGSPFQSLRGKVGGYEFKNDPMHRTDDYNFAAQTFSATITVPGNYTFTMSPCPYGVAGANTHHYLYISGGVGTAEAALINGGTCTSGASSGTIQLAVANAHSGSYTIASATAGFQEAVNVAAAAGGGVIFIPAGTHTVYAATRIKSSNIYIHGTGGASRVSSASLTAHVFHFDGPSATDGELDGQGYQNAISDLFITQVAGDKVDGSAVYMDMQNIFFAERIWADYFNRAFAVMGGYSNYLTRLAATHIRASTGSAIYVDQPNDVGSSDLFIHECFGSSASPNHAYAGIHIIEHYGFYITNSSMFAVGKPLAIEPTAGKTVQNGFMYGNAWDSGKFDCIAMQTLGAGAKILTMSFTGDRTAACQGYGVVMAVTAGEINGVRFTNHNSTLNHKDGFAVLTTGVSNWRIGGGSIIGHNNATFNSLGLVIQIVVSGTTATITTPFPHGWSTGSTLTISGVTSDTDLNGTHTLTVGSTTTATFTVASVTAGTYSTDTDSGLRMKSNLYSNVFVAGGVSNWSISDNFIGDFDGQEPVTGTNPQTWGINIATGANDNYRITGNHFTLGTLGFINDSGTGVNKIITGNLPSSVDVYPTSCVGLTSGTIRKNGNALEVCP